MKDTWGNYLCRVSGERYEKIHLRLLPPQSNKRILNLTFYYPQKRLKIVIRLLNPRYDSGTKFVETVKPIVVGDGNENALTYERESLTGKLNKLAVVFIYLSEFLFKLCFCFFLQLFNLIAEGSSKIRITFDEDNDVIECCSTEANLKPKMKITPCSSTNDCQMARKYLEKSCDLHKNENCDNFVDNTSKGCVGYPLATGSVSEGKKILRI